jgi:hypothetical protein
MPTDSLWIKIPEIIGIPLGLLFVLAYIKGAAAQQRPGRESLVDLGMEFAILAAGACGSIFASDRIEQIWGGTYVAVYGILATVVCIVFMAILAKLRRWQTANIGWWQGFWNVALGVIPILLVTTALVIGYTVDPRR